MRGCGSRGFRGAAALLYLVGCAMASPVLAQGIGGGGLIQSYTFDEPEVVGLGRFRLVTAPFAVAIPLGRYLGVVASGAWAEGVATGPGGEEVTLSGLTDTQLGIAVGLGRDRAVLSGGVTLPTGQSTQTLGETAVAGVVSAELLPFAIKSWGTGGGAGGDLALAFDAGRWGIGLSGGYQAAREYEPLSGEAFAYRPGDQIRARLALDRDVGESGTLSVLIGLQSFGEDEAQGNNLFKSGNRLEGVMSYAFALGLRGSALAYAGIYHRENGSLLTEDQVIDGAADSPSQQLFMGGVNVRTVPNRRFSILADGDIRVFRSEDGVGQGWVGTVGVSLSLLIAGRPSGTRLVLSPAGRYRLGHVTVREGAESGLTGWEAGVTLRLETGR